MPSPATSFNTAISAYNQTPKGAGAGVGMEARDASAGDEFAGLVKNAIQEAIKIGEQSEKISVAAIQDKADLNQVVSAVAEAEITLQTVVAVRDKVLEAYKQIIRMPM